MLFNSASYILIFLPIVLIIYVFLSMGKQEQGSKVWLITSSLFFYAFWNLSYLPVLVCSILLNFCFSRMILRFERSRKALLTMGICLNLSCLFVFKYYDFVAVNISEVFSISMPALLDVLLPLGISFFTFQQIAYLVDTYKGEVARNSLLDYSLFVSFFPQLIAGPIVHHREMMPQFRKDGRSVVNWDDFAVGLIIFSIGLFKKVLIADTLAQGVAVGYANASNLSLLNAWCVTLSYTFQIYFDFSGYTDMALGAANYLGFHFL